VHYVAGAGQHSGREGQFGRLLGWLSDGHLAFADCGNPYDVIRLPGFEFGIEHPEARYRAALEARFADQHAAIAQWFDTMAKARTAAEAMFAARGLPSWAAWSLRWWRHTEIEHWSTRMLAEVLADIPDARLRAVLGARWADYGGPPSSTPVIEHAVVTGAYNFGAYFPVGGPGRFAQTLMPPVLAAGGRWDLGATVERIELTQGRVDTVVYRQGDTLQCAKARQVISAMGVHNTADALAEPHAAEWKAELRAFKPGLSCLALNVGFEGDIVTAGATCANCWIYESEDISGVWRRPADEDAPALFVSFPSLKDPQATGHPTAEVLAVCEASAFAPWMELPPDRRPEDYRIFKARVEERLLAQFLRHYPKLVPLLRFHEMSTPLTQRNILRAPGGAMYGLEPSAERMTSARLDVRSPVAGLLLAGQDVFGAGVPSAAMSGLLAAAAIDLGLLRKLGE
jgi:all-trans-retinol 13,14-reductase